MVAPSWWVGPTLAPVDEAQRASVRHAQRVLRLDESGEMDDITKAGLRAVQALFRLRVTGVLDLPTAEKIEEIRNRFA
jgi:hypothetical protein